MLRVAFLILALVGCGQPVAEIMEPPVGPAEVRQIDLAPPDIELLPFSVRLNKLAHVFETSIEDEMFDELLQHRFALGDHNYARALRPDKRWSARKMGLWIRSLLPICSSTRLSELYPALTSAPDLFILSAYGRAADAADQSVLDDFMSQSAMGSDSERSYCLAILSSMEFVAR